MLGAIPAVGQGGEGQGTAKESRMRITTEYLDKMQKKRQADGMNISA